MHAHIYTQYHTHARTHHTHAHTHRQSMATTSWTAVVSPSDAPPSLPAASPPISGRPTKTCLMGQRSLPWGCSWNSGWSSVAMTTGSFRKCVIFQMWHNHKMEQCTNTLQAVKMGACVFVGLWLYFGVVKLTV